MKEIIVIEDKEVRKVCENCGEYGEGCIMKENCKNKNTLRQTECCFNFGFTPKFKIEKCPTNWEELKELCKRLKEEDILATNDCIVFRDLIFYKSGIICVPDSEYFSISQNKTPQQMWGIIKTLVGE